jgi:hypothetical protein|eukprot:COSAG03_NODE_39_length_17408_cov_16.363972_19_plen_100_part_00
MCAGAAAVGLRGCTAALTINCGFYFLVMRQSVPNRRNNALRTPAPLPLIKHAAAAATAPLNRVDVREITEDQALHSPRISRPAVVSPQRRIAAVGSRRP